MSESSPQSLGEARDRRAGVRAALSALERAIATSAAGHPEEWAGAVDARVAALQDAFDHHVVLTESPDGLLADVLRDAPRLTHRVEVIKADHVEIRAGLARARDDLSRRPFDATQVEAAWSSVLDLMRRVMAHRHLGADLVYDAYNVDIEAAD